MWEEHQWGGEEGEVDGTTRVIGHGDNDPMWGHQILQGKSQMGTRTVVQACWWGRETDHERRWVWGGGKKIFFFKLGKRMVLGKTISDGKDCRY